MERVIMTCFAVNIKVVSIQKIIHLTTANFMMKIETIRYRNYLFNGSNLGYWFLFDFNDFVKDVRNTMYANNMRWNFDN